MATGNYTLSGNGQTVKFEELEGGKISVTNATTGKSKIFDSSEVANKLGQLGASNQTNKINVTNDAGQSNNVTGAYFAMNTTAGQKALADQGLVNTKTADGRNNWVNQSPTPTGGSSSSSSVEDPMVKALAEANARAAKAEIDRKATIEAAEMLQKNTKKATDAVSAGQTQTAVNAEMGKDITQTTPESASADYQNALANAITTKPTVTAGEKNAVVSEEEAKSKAVQNQLDQAELARQQYELDSKKLMDKRASADMEEAKSNADYEAKKLEAKQKELDLQVEQTRKKAEKDIYDQERIASLNMMKLGLVGSGSAVATFQAIATSGITRLSEIQAEYSNKSAMLALDAKREADKLVYDLNKISDNYVEKRLIANKEGAEAIAKYQRSTTENQLQKDSNIKKKLDELKKEKQDDLEWSLKLYKERADQAQLAEDRLQKKADKLKADGKEKIKILTDTGAWAKLSDEERAKLETDAGMPIGSSRMIIGKLVGEDVQKLIDDQGIRGYFPSGSAMDKLNSRVDQLLNAGKDRVTATNIAFGELAQSDPALKASLAKANAVKSSGAGTVKEDVIRDHKYTDESGAQVTTKLYDNDLRRLMDAKKVFFSNGGTEAEWNRLQSQFIRENSVSLDTKASPGAKPVMVTNELNQPVSAEYDQHTGRYYPVGSAVGQRPDGSKIYPSEKAITRYEKKDESIDFGQAVSE